MIGWPPSANHIQKNPTQYPFRHIVRATLKVLNVTYSNPRIVAIGGVILSAVAAK